jgi:hypothetical protein
MVLVNRFKGIVTGVGDLLEQIVKVLLLNSVVNHEVTNKFGEPARIASRRLVKLSEFLVVTDQCLDDVHVFYPIKIGCLVVVTKGGGFPPFSQAIQDPSAHEVVIE